MKREENKRKGITLIALVVIVIVLLILVAITVEALKSDNSFINQTLAAQTKTIEESIEEYVLAIYTGITSNPYLINDPLDELEARIINENMTKSIEERYNVQYADKENHRIMVEHQGINVMINLPNAQEGEFDAFSEETRYKKYSIVFFFYNIYNIEQRAELFVNKGQTIREYLNITGESLPKTTIWSPELDLDSIVDENRTYREVQ